MEVREEMTEKSFKTLYKKWKTCLFDEASLTIFCRFNDQIEGKWAYLETTSFCHTFYFSRELFELPRKLVEYVIVHELLHINSPNHGMLFKAHLSSLLPDWEEREKSLKKYVPAQISIQKQPLIIKIGGV